MLSDTPLPPAHPHRQPTVSGSDKHFRGSPNRWPHLEPLGSLFAPGLGRKRGSFVSWRSCPHCLDQFQHSVLATTTLKPIGTIICRTCRHFLSSLSLQRRSSAHLLSPSAQELLRISRQQRSSKIQSKVRQAITSSRR